MCTWHAQGFVKVGSHDVPAFQSFLSEARVPTVDGGPCLLLQGKGWSFSNSSGIGDFIAACARLLLRKRQGCHLHRVDLPYHAHPEGGGWFISPAN